MGKPRKNVPAHAQARQEHKAVRYTQASQSDHPSWRFSTVDRDGPFAWPKNDDVELQIVQKLHSFDSMRWAAIEGPDHHLIEVQSLSKDAQRRLQEIGQDDIDSVYSFHFTGKRRIIGIRESSTVKLLWWDPEHQVCPSKKKNT